MTMSFTKLTIINCSKKNKKKMLHYISFFKINVLVKKRNITKHVFEKRNIAKHVFLGIKYTLLLYEQKLTVMKVKRKLYVPTSKLFNVSFYDSFHFWQSGRPIACKI